MCLRKKQSSHVICLRRLDAELLVAATRRSSQAPSPVAGRDAAIRSFLAARLLPETASSDTGGRNSRFFWNGTSGA